MAIRLRIVDGHWIAVCAAKTKAKKDDIYLDDNMHHALSTKFAIDWDTEDISSAGCADLTIAMLIKGEENQGK